MPTNSSIIDRIQLVAVYERNLEIRKRVFEFEKGLSSYLHKPYKIIAVPDSENPEIPRFQANDQKCNLEVNQVRAIFTQGYEPNTSITKIKELLNKRVMAIKPLVVKESIQFVALIAELKYYFNDNNEIFDIFKSNTKASVTNKPNLKEFSLFYARSFKDKFFINIASTRFEQVQYDLKLHDQTAKQVDKKIGITITVDLNTKFGFQNKVVFQEQQFNEIEEYLFDVIQKKSLEDYLSGEIDL